MQTRELIDLDHLEKYVAGDIALRDEILSIFTDQAEMLMTQFNVAQTDEGWKNTAHALKGAARGVGAWALGDFCEEAEALIGAVPAKRENRSSMLVSIRQKLSESVEEAIRLRDAA